MGRDMKKKNAKFVVEFRSEEEKKLFLEAHQYLAQRAVDYGETFLSAHTFGAVCIVKEVNRLAAELRRITEAAEEAEGKMGAENVE